MLLVMLLIISQTTCEWVEITQNNHRKEPPRRSQSNIEHDGAKDLINYMNQSTAEKQWNKAVIDRVTNVGNIRRVQVPSVKTPSMKARPVENNMDKYNNDRGFASLDSFRRSPQQNPTFVAETSTNHKERVSLPRTTSEKPVKLTQSIFSEEEIGLKFSTQQPFNRRKITIDDEIFNQNEDKFPNENGVFGNYKKIINTMDTLTPIHKVHNEELSPRFSTPTPKTIKVNFNKHNFDEYQDFENFAKDNKEYASSNNNFPNSSITSKPKYHITKLDEMSSLYTTEYTTSPYTSKYETWHHKTNIKQKNVFQGSEKYSNSTKDGSISGMLKLMKTISDIIYKNTHRTFKSKIKYLEDLTNTITSTIEEHVESVWPDEIEHRSGRSARSEPRGHLELPSSESTLMTISFLTFAVFLIKLVLQVIHTYKNKTMMVTPAVVAAVGRAAAAIRAKHT